jgi:tetratricopeptide (TPR) repeat protein
LRDRVLGYDPIFVAEQTSPGGAFLTGWAETGDGYYDTFTTIQIFPESFFQYAYLDLVPLALFGDPVWDTHAAAPSYSAGVDYSYYYSYPDFGYSSSSTTQSDLGSIYSATQALSKLDIMQGGRANCQIEYLLGVEALNLGYSNKNEYLEQARQRFQAITSSGTCSSEALITRSEQYYGDALLFLGQTQQAAEQYRKARASKFLKLADPLAWAVVSQNLAHSLRSIAEADSDAPLLEEAIAMYRESIAGYKSLPHYQQKYNYKLQQEAMKELSSTQTFLAHIQTVAKSGALLDKPDLSTPMILTQRKKPVARRSIVASRPPSFFDILFGLKPREHSTYTR